MPISNAFSHSSDVQNEVLPRSFVRESLTKTRRKTDPNPAAFFDAVHAIAGKNSDQVIHVFCSDIPLFFSLSVTSVHALGLALVADVITSAGDFIYKKDKEVLKQVLKNDWIGSAKILQKLPPIMLSPEQYQKLRNLLGCVTAKKYLQHTNIIDGDTIDVLHALPEQLRVRPVMKHLRCQSEAELLSSLSGAVTNMNGLIQKAKDADSRSKFWDEGCTHLVARAFDLQTGPVIAHPDINQVKSPVELLKIAKSFRNCLRNYVGEGVSGETVFYIYRGQEPVVISVESRFGQHAGIIKEMKTAGNGEVSETTREVIVHAFKEHGIIDCSGGHALYGDDIYQQLLSNLYALSRKRMSRECIEEECREAIDRLKLFQRSG
ncbi:hypothetical protein [Maricaulis sp.]|uniref:hypothetical protein n=1 Tax=Maricaulis sp. TaxID=1486257 RepID=UPI000C4B3E88|nr:hypothetical protein [Maricaulis sp.]MAC89385.1 hypothetical protein [Maricaulis sp.]